MGDVRHESVEPRWRLLAVATVVSALLGLLVAPPSTALYWYVFPLFGLGITYVIQFHAEFPLRWRVALVPTALVSVVALALDWPFSGHVLWNVLFIGHAWTNGKRRSTWMALLVGSLIYLFALKLVSQTTRDLVGAFIAVGVAAIALALLRRRPSLR